MIDPKLLRNNIEAVNAALAKRGVQLDVQEWASLETRRKDLQSKTEKLQAERNAGAKQVGQIKKSGGDASEIMARMQAIGDEIKAAEVALSELQNEIEQKALSIPNLPDESVPAGKDENDNVTVYVSHVDRSSGEPKLVGVDDEEEWNRVKDVLRELSKAE